MFYLWRQWGIKSVYCTWRNLPVIKTKNSPILLENIIIPVLDFVLDLVGKNKDDVECSLLSTPQIRNINYKILAGKEAVKCKS